MAIQRYHFDLFADYYQFYYGKLDALSKDGLAGDDHYTVALRPGECIEPAILKARRTDRRR